MAGCRGRHCAAPVSTLPWRAAIFGRSEGSMVTGLQGNRSGRGGAGSGVREQLWVGMV